MNTVLFVVPAPTERLAELAESSGFQVVENTYVQRQTVNLKEGVCVPRVFLQAKLRKPIQLVTPDELVEVNPLEVDGVTTGTRKDK